MKQPFILGVVILIGIVRCMGAAAAEPGAPWRDKSNQARLSNQAIEATFQAGFLVQVKDKVTGKLLLAVDPNKLLAKMPLFGPAPIDLEACSV